MDFCVELPEILDAKYNIKDYGAVAGGRMSNTAAIKNTIKAAAENGGGHIIIPAGIWLTGPIELKSGIDLHLEQGALLLFDKNKEEYPLIITNYEGIRHIRAVSPISAKNAQNVSITGEGVIDGNGHLWRICKEFKVTERHWKKMTAASPDTIMDTKEGGIWFPTKTAYEGYQKGEPNLDDPKALELAAPYYDFYRPVMVDLTSCDKVLIEGVTLQNSPAWNLHPIFCTNVTIRDAQIRNEAYAQNGDGLDLESCSLVEVARVKFSVGDDAICMKSGKNAGARKIPVPTERVYIHDCIVYNAHGGFVVGSEMSRGVRNVRISDCTFMGTDVGIRFKSALGRGGVVEDIDIENINMTEISGEAILFTMGYQLSTFAKSEEQELADIDPEDIPEFKNIRIRNVDCLGAQMGLKVEGLPQMPIHDIVLENVNIVAKKGYEITNAENIILKNVNIKNAENNKETSFDQRVLANGDYFN